MKRRLTLLLSLCVVLGFCPAHATARTPAPARVNGSDYVPLAEWARAKNFDWRWIKHDETLQLTNPNAKVQFIVGSRETYINNVQVWLLFPLIARGGVLYITRLDLETTLRPVLFPPQSFSEIKTICLDPGHGGKDPGNRVGSNEEKKYTLLLAFEIREQLKEAGFKVVMTRTTDRFVELPDRPYVARSRKADLFVSLHFNAAEIGRDQANGAESYCLTPFGASSTNARGEGADAGSAEGNRFNDKNFLLAYQIQKSLVRSLGVEDRGVRRARYAVLRDAAMPAVLIEAGFMSHPVEGKKIFDPAYRRDMARAIVDSILAYKRIVERAN